MAAASVWSLVACGLRPHVLFRFPVKRMARTSGVGVRARAYRLLLVLARLVSRTSSDEAHAVALVFELWVVAPTPVLALVGVRGDRLGRRGGGRDRRRGRSGRSGRGRGCDEARRRERF